MNNDAIEIRRLRVKAYIGVPEDERASEQDVWISIKMYPSQGFVGLGDDVANTVDYHQVSREIAGLAAAKPRRLIETLANEIAEHLLARHPLSSALVEVEKHILPDADGVAVRISRNRM